ncbi:major IEV antigen [NY_014 poxvirus]|uniref:major IEV antigen n=1 Tax=NY_014 poxvirus TaxID=2025360 RepID=UPI000B9A0088|nr:major IEV antigen [NY_014 poxvirus]AST09444.1 major IEV antigen [NY_014 poxvirus]
MWPFSSVPPGAKCRLVETLPNNMDFRSNNLKTFECFDEIISLAKKYIYIASFCCNPLSTDGGALIFDKLKEASEKGVKVIILIDEKGKKNVASLQEFCPKIEFITINIDKTNNLGILLGCFWVSDNQRCYLGNASFTGGSINTIKTLGVYSDYPLLAIDLRRRFDTFKAFNSAKTSLLDLCSMACCLPVNTAYHINNPIGGVFFTDSPEHLLGYSRTLDADIVISKLKSAKNSIDIEHLAIVPTVRTNNGDSHYWPNIYNAIVEAAINRGVKVRLLIGNWNKNDAYSMVTAKSLDVLCSKNDLQVKVFTIQNNTKLLIIDDEYIHITSANFDGTHYQNHGFVSFNCVDKTLVDEAKRIFERDWESSHSKSLKI